MITRDMISDEARLRIADLIGCHRGGHVEHKLQQLLTAHVLAPSPRTRTLLHGFLQLVACANKLERSLPDDYRHGRHWQVHQSLIPDAGDSSSSSDALNGRIRQLEGMVAAMQAVPQPMMIEQTTPQPPPPAQVTTLAPIPPPGPTVDLESIEMEATALIMRVADEVAMRMQDGTALLETAAEMTTAMRKAQSETDILRIRDEVLAFIAERQRQAA